MTKQTILIVEDEAEIREGIRILLSGENYSILEAENGEQALNQMSDQIDLVILDVMMPGISVCEEIRKTSTVPILFLTAKAQESDKLIGLTAGGDDYLVKPFSYAELIARVKALLRRYCVYQGKGQPAAPTRTTCFPPRASPSPWTTTRCGAGEERDLTEIEYQILRLLMQRPQWIFSPRPFTRAFGTSPTSPFPTAR